MLTTLVWIIKEQMFYWLWKCMSDSLINNYFIIKYKVHGMVTRRSHRLVRIRDIPHITVFQCYFLAHLSWKLKWAFLIAYRPSSVFLSDRPSVFLSVCKFFLISTSSQKPLSQFQPNLAQSVLGWRGFRFVQIKGPSLFQREMITKYRKYIDKIF